MNKREEERKKRQQEKLEQELSRLEAMSVYEREYEGRGLICGIDEVGRGPLAGPVVAGAVILPKDETILYLNDSKKLSAKKREALYEEILEKEWQWGSAWRPLQGSTRSTSFRPLMRPCGQPSRILA